jgi:hypothetical protein
MVSINKIKPYAIYDSVYDLQYMELYSGSERDPVVDASVYADDNLAFDPSGNKLPFSIQVGLNAQYLDRSKYLLEDMDKRVVRCSQRVTVTIIVFNNIDDYLCYENGERTWIDL